MSNRVLTVQTDGGSRGNPGDAGMGIVIYDEGQLIYEHGEFLGTTTNNVAEYSALVHALKQCIHFGASEVIVKMDSELIVKQMNGIYKIKDSKMQELAAEVMKLKNRFDKVSFIHVRREFNKAADALVNRAIDEALTDRG